MSEKSEKSKKFQKAFNSLLSYCQYQERSSKEVAEKLWKFDLNPDEFDEIVNYLRDNSFFSDERFVENYVNSKLSKSWGRIKIKYHLRTKLDNNELVEKTLENIDIDEYKNTIRELIESKKRKLAKEQDSYKKKQKISLFLQNKGFEISFILDELNK